MLKGFKVRLMPTVEQEQLFVAKLNGARAVWNWGLAEQMRNYKETEKHLSAYELRNLLRNLKNTDSDYAWLGELGATILTEPLFDLDKAYKAFFAYRKSNGKKYSVKQIARAKRENRQLTSYEQLKHPKFKKKGKCKESFPIRYDRTVFKDSKVTVEAVGRVFYQTDLDLSVVSKVYNPRITREGNKWLLSFTGEVENQDYTLNDYGMGIDVGVKDLATVSCNGEITIYKNINKTAKMKKKEKRLARLQRQASKTEKGSNRQAKAYAKVNSQYKSMSNIRKDYVHSVSHSIVSSLPKVICIEDLNIAGMLKNRHLSKAIQDSKLSELLRQIEYKSANRVVKLVKADKFYPSSKTCSVCGYVNKELQLSDRHWVCPECNTKHDRDENAALNLERYGLAHM